MVKRATPEMFSLYKLSITLHKTFNEAIPETEWIGLNFDQVNMSRQRDFRILKINKLLIGRNILCNRFYELNGKIPLEWFNMSKNAFKIICKNKFLTHVS